MKKVLLLPLFFSFISLNANALSTCDAILQQGIFDSYSVLDNSKKHDLIKKSWCRTTEKERGGGAGLKVFKIFSFNGKGKKADIAKYCQSSYKNIRKDKRFKQITEQASSVIAQAWTTCITSNINQVSHYITPMSDPGRFIYGAIFKSTSDSSTKQVNFNYWAVSGAKCPEDFKKRSINGNRFEMTCFRNPKSSVAINAQSSSFGANLRTVQLAAHQDSSCGAFFKKPGGHFNESYTDLGNNRHQKLALTLDSVAGSSKSGSFSGWLYKPYNKGGWMVKGSYSGKSYTLTHKNNKGHLLTGSGSCDSYGAVGEKRYTVGSNRRYSVEIR